jgi:hypothetical protein
MSCILDAIDGELDAVEIVNCGFSLVCLGLSEMSKAERARVLQILVEEVEAGIRGFDSIKPTRAPEHRTLN